MLPHHHQFPLQALLSLSFTFSANSVTSPSATFNHPQIAELTLLSTNVLTSILCILIGLDLKKKKVGCVEGDEIKAYD